MNPIMRSLWLLVLLVAAACQPEIPALPPVTVNVTAVDDQIALDDAVALALTGTAEQLVFATETALALGGITLTPTRTPTLTNTPLPPTETPFLSPTPTPTPTNTVTPTFAPPSTSEPPTTLEDRAGGRVRVLHAWRGQLAQAVDVYIDDVRLHRGLSEGEATAYFNSPKSTVRVSINEIPLQAGQPTPESARLTPIVSQVVEIPASGSLSVLLVEDDGAALLPLADNVSPLSAGESRVSLLQVNSFLLRSNVLLPGLGSALAYDMEMNDRHGPFDLLADEYQMILVDADSPEERVGEFFVELKHFTNHLIAFVPPGPGAGALVNTEILVFESSTNRASADTSAYFVNGAVDAGTVNIEMDRQTVWTNLPTGSTTQPIPISNEGTELRVVDAGTDADRFAGFLLPFTDADPALNRIVVLVDAPGSTPENPTVLTQSFLQNPRPNPQRASLRLINALGGTTRPLDLEIRATNPIEIENAVGVPQSQQASSAWTTVAEGVLVGESSPYEVRSPNLFDVRLVLSGTQTIQARLSDVQLVPGGVYDFVAVPGDAVGTARLLILQPDMLGVIQGASQDINEIVAEQVEIALTASVPAVTATATPRATATATITPVPTNTPRPSNTPSLPPAAVQVRPAPPDAVYDFNLVVRGEGFVADERYTIQIDGGPDIQSGRINPDGTMATNISLPVDIAPGPHVVSVCVDCRTGGINQQAFATFVVAESQTTPTVTPQP